MPEPTPRRAEGEEAEAPEIGGEAKPKAAE
jgi:hypothetical protein